MDSTQAEPSTLIVPEHIAIIMDGNGRWAEKQGKPRHSGHKEGVTSVRSTIEACAKKGVKVLTLFAFSSENWKRPKKEVSLLMELFFTALHREIKRLHANGIRLQVIGDVGAFSDKLQARIKESELLTKDNSTMLLQIAANYGGRWDITQAAKKVATAVKSGELAVDDINEELLGKATAFPDAGDPDLFIRTGGEKRISNFLLWQCAYSELYFTDTLWPDFSPQCLEEAIVDFSTRQRRFGKTGQQIKENTT